MEKLAWHYTTGENFLKIVESGVLLPTGIRIGVREKPVLWFSKNEIWEPTACKGRVENGRYRCMDRHETRCFGRGLVRFGYPAHKLHPWQNLQKVANIDVRDAICLEQAGKQSFGANPGDWMGTLSKIPLKKLICEVLDGDWDWVRVKNK